MSVWPPLTSQGMRLAGAATVAGVDLGLWAEVPAALFDRWRELRFVDGVLVDSAGMPRHGLTLETGTHPLPGARYRLVTGSEESPEWARNTSSLDILEISPESFVVRIQNRTTNSIGAVVSYIHPRSGRRGPEMEVKVDGGVEGRWPLRGTVSGHVEIDVDTHAGLFNRNARLIAHGQHTRAGGRAEVSVVEVGAETVDVSIVVHVHGRGVLFPLAAVFGLFAGGRLRKEFSSSVRTLADDVAALSREMLESAGPALTPDSVADHLFAGFLESIATNLPNA